MWATTTWGLMRFDGSLWEDVREELNLRFGVREVAARRARRNAVDRHRPRRHVPAAGATRVPRTDIQTSDGDVDFVEAPDGTLWLTDERLGARAVYVPNGDAVTADWIALRDARQEALWGKLIDRDGTLWMASAAGIHRVKDVARLLDPHVAAGASQDAFSEVDGLTAPLRERFPRRPRRQCLDRHGRRRGPLSRIATDASGSAARRGRLRRSPPATPVLLFVGIDSDVGVFRVTPPSTVDVVPGPTPHHLCLSGRRRCRLVRRPRTCCGIPADRPGSEWIPIEVPIDRGNADFYPVQAITKDRAGGCGSRSSAAASCASTTASGRASTIPRSASPPARTDASGSVIRRTSCKYVDGDAVREFSAGEGLDLGNVIVDPAARAGRVGGRRARPRSLRRPALSRRHASAAASHCRPSPASSRRRRAICG